MLKPSVHAVPFRSQDYRQPPKDMTPVKVRAVRGLMLRGEPVTAGSVLTVPRWEADDLLATGRAELKLK